MGKHCRPACLGAQRLGMTLWETVTTRVLTHLLKVLRICTVEVKSTDPPVDKLHGEHQKSLTVTEEYSAS